MHRLSNELTNNLASFNQRKLVQGEIFLLAKAIADNLPLAPFDIDNMTIHNLSHRRFIDEVIYHLNDFTYLDEESVKQIYKLVDELSIWRFNVAYIPPAILFKGEANNVIDDLSGLARYVNLGAMCSVADIVDTANFKIRIFYNLCAEAKQDMAVVQA